MKGKYYSPTTILPSVHSRLLTKLSCRALPVFFPPVSSLANGRVIPVRETDHQWPLQYNRYISNTFQALLLLFVPNFSGAGALPRSGCIFALFLSDSVFASASLLCSRSFLSCLLGTAAACLTPFLFSSPDVECALRDPRSLFETRRA